MQTKYSEGVSQNQSLASGERAPHPFIEALRPITSRVRTDATAMWLPNKDTGALEVNWTRQELTDQRLIEHLEGGSPRGVCPIRAGESTTRLALLDLDSHKGEVSADEMSYEAQALSDVLERRGFAVIPFRSSGGNGMHLFMLWEEPQDAYSVRMALREALALCGYKDGAKGLREKAIEVFPKQDSVAEGKFGNQFFLPLARKSVPLDNGPFGLEPLPREAVLDIEWRMSRPVPVLQKPEPKAPLALAAPVDLAEIRRMLFAVKNDPIDGPDYEGWRNIVFAVHAGTNGAAEGLEMLSEWSQQNTAVWEKDPTHRANRVWPYIDSTREGAITINTLKSLAREHGWQEDHSVGFQPVEPPADELPPFERDKSGAPLATIPNVLAAVRRPDVCGARFARDNFKAADMIDDGKRFRTLKDNDYTRLREHLQKNLAFRPIDQKAARDAILLVAEENEFDSAQMWLTRQKWDGVPRVASFLPRYFGAADTPYTRAVSRYIWTALAGRTLSPGLKADMAPVAVGAQGLMKSSAIKAMAPHIDNFFELNLAARDDDTSRNLAGRQVVELGELRGIQARDAEDVKAFIVRTEDRWIPKYQEHSTSNPRRCLFFGSTNKRIFLFDETGHRRWLPFDAGKCDPVSIERDRDQLWAEGAAMFKADGLDFREAEDLARAEHVRFEDEDSWAPAIVAYLETGSSPGMFGEESPAEIRPLDRVTTRDLLLRAIGKRIADIKRNDEMRVASIMTRMRWERVRAMVNGVRDYFYTRPSPVCA